MIVTQSEIPDVLIFEPKLFEDSRGHFFESFNAKVFEQAVGFHPEFVQDNQSRSKKGVLRGLHYQIKNTQGKLVRVISGEIFDVAVDLRRSSKTFRRWVGLQLSSENRHTVWIPEGFAHGFLTVTEYSEVLYKTTDYWAPEHERTIAWNDRELGIQWPLQSEPIVNVKDSAGLRLSGAELFD
jgi:dTDP-4-dehydrorhamnose 3,5-epimerase